MQTSLRKRIETILLAFLGIASVMPLRYFVESHVWFFLEMTSLLIAFIGTVVAQSHGERYRGAKHAVVPAAVALAMTPAFFAVAARWLFASPIAFEISMLSTGGATSLAIAAVARTGRTLSLSLITSGFLVLFCTAISDDQYAIVLPLVWMLLCVWHLVANHWERLEMAMPDSIQRNFYLRPSIALLTLLVLAIGAYVVKDRIPNSNQLLFGFMPTSGGSVWTDPAARDGVGNGDAAIAAKDHAESFGAVDSDIFLESTESTLFDMANDMIGEPIPKIKWERRQSVGNENFISMHESASRTEQGGGIFSTERMPPKKHRHLNDAKDPALVQWDGPTGIRLAMHRYDHFDGHDWSQSKDYENKTLTPVNIGDATWFFNPRLRPFLQDNSDAVSVGLLKVNQLNSQRIPAPMMTAGVHVKEVDRQDFFGIHRDGSLFMPDRERIPPLTVVHIAGLKIMEDEIRHHLVAQPNRQTSISNSVTGVTASMLEVLINSVNGQDMIPFEQLSACLDKLRREFTFDRNGSAAAGSLREFLKTRRGGDHLFATTAALLARKLGLPSRLVEGFYVRPEAFDITAGHASVLPRDVHLWAEVQLNDGRWIEIEPTPGYQQPVYHPSWWLVTRRWAAASWPILLAGITSLGSIYITRRAWIDWLLTISWSLSGWLRPRWQIRLAIRIIETRAQLAGQRRPPGTTQRAWLEQLTMADETISRAAARFCDAADALCFGNSNQFTASNAAGLVGWLQIRTINQMTQESKS